MEALTKRELVEKLQQFPDNMKVFAGSQYHTDTDGFLVEVAAIMDVERSQCDMTNTGILLIVACDQ